MGNSSTIVEDLKESGLITSAAFTVYFPIYMAWGISAVGVGLIIFTTDQKGPPPPLNENARVFKYARGRATRQKLAGGPASKKTTMAILAAYKQE